MLSMAEPTQDPKTHPAVGLLHSGRKLLRTGLHWHYIRYAGYVQAMLKPQKVDDIPI